MFQGDKLTMSLYDERGVYDEGKWRTSERNQREVCLGRKPRMSGLDDREVCEGGKLRKSMWMKEGCVIKCSYLMSIGYYPVLDE